MTGVALFTKPVPTAREHLQRLLTDRFVRATGRAPLDPLAPRVVRLGEVDIRSESGGLKTVLRHQATVHLSAQAILIGPWGTGAGHRGCGNCLAIRWQQLRPGCERDALELSEQITSVAPWPFITTYLTDAAWSVYLATVLTAREGQNPSDRLPRVSEVDIRTLAVRTVELLSESRCPSCAPTQTHTKTTATPHLRSRQKPTPDGYRLRSVDAYSLPVNAMINPICGALGRDTSADLTNPTSAPISGRIGHRVEETRALIDISWSGHTDSYAQSRGVALLEGLERHAGISRRRNDQHIIDSYANLQGQALDPRECGVYAPEVYADSSDLLPFSPQRRISWVWGYSLRDHRPILVPASTCYYGGDYAGEHFVNETSSGCASGSCLEEAILFAILELIERDAFLLCWYGGVETTHIELDESRDPTLRDVLERVRLNGYEPYVFDSRIDLAIPVVTAMAVRHDGGPGTLAFSAGASLCPDQAIRGALAELTSFLPRLSTAVDRRRVELTAMATDFTLVRALSDHADLFGLPAMSRHARRYLQPAATMAYSEVYRGWRGRPQSGDLFDDVAYCRDQIVAAGMDVIVVDQTSTEQEAMGLSTVRAIVPGMIPIDFGWNKQRALRLPRMFSAFRRAGIRVTDLDESELHRVPHPFP